MRLVFKRITNRNRSLLSGPGAAAPKFQGEKRGTLMKIQGFFFSLQMIHPSLLAMGSCHLLVASGFSLREIWVFDFAPSWWEGDVVPAKLLPAKHPTSLGSISRGASSSSQIPGSKYPCAWGRELCSHLPALGEFLISKEQRSKSCWELIDLIQPLWSLAGCSC